MISTHEPRMKMIRLNEIAFFGDIPALLGVSRGYARSLANPPDGKKGEWYKLQRFPQPFYVSPSGIRVWWVSDIEKWCAKINLKRTKLREMGSTLMYRPTIADKILGRR